MKISLNNSQIKSLVKLRDEYLEKHELSELFILDFLKDQYNCDLDHVSLDLYGAEEDITLLLLKL